MGGIISAVLKWIWVDHLGFRLVSIAFALVLAVVMAFCDISVASMCTLGNLSSVFRVSFNREIAMQPLPVPTSRILISLSLSLLSSSISISTRNSVSGRGISVCLFTKKSDS